MKFPKVSKDSLRALAYEIRNEMSGGIAVDDSRFSIRHIENEIKHIHAQVQKEIDELNEREGVLPDHARKKIFPCIPLVDTNDFYCKCTKTGGRFKKAILPKLYKWKNQSFIEYLGNTDMDFNFTPADGIFELNALPILAKRPAYTIIDDAAYVSLPEKDSLMCELTMIGIPEDPNATSGRCFDVWSENWNVDRHIKSIVKERAMMRLGNNLLKTSPNMDIRNNAQDGNQVTTLLGQ